MYRPACIASISIGSVAVHCLGDYTIRDRTKHILIALSHTVGHANTRRFWVLWAVTLREFATFTQRDFLPNFNLRRETRAVSLATPACPPYLFLPACRTASSHHRTHFWHTVRRASTARSRSLRVRHLIPTRSSSCQNRRPPLVTSPNFASGLRS